MGENSNITNEQLFEFMTKMYGDLTGKIDNMDREMQEVKENMATKDGLAKTNQSIVRLEKGKAQGDKPSPLARVPGTTRLLSKLANEIKKDPNGVKSKGFLFLCKECICQVKIPLYSNPKFLFTL